MCLEWEDQYGRHNTCQQRRTRMLPQCIMDAFAAGGWLAGANFKSRDHMHFLHLPPGAACAGSGSEPDTRIERRR